MKVRIHVDREEVQLGAINVEGQWVDFYALLALARTERTDLDAYVTSATLARVGPWRHKAAGSVGKEVARHLVWLERAKLGGVVVCRGRTRAWRLDVPPRAVTFTPSRTAVRGWLDARSRPAAPAGDWMGHLRALIEATAAIQQGDAEGTLDRLSAFASSSASAEPALEAWSALLRGKASLQHDDEEDDLLARLHDAWDARTDAAGRAVGVRLRTYLALRHRFAEPAATMASLTKLAADLELRGDIGSLGMVENVRGLLVRRTGDAEAATAHHLRALALFGIAGDLPSLQAALFNLALCRREALERAGRAPDEGVLELVELCLLVCARFNVGNDSAQAEIAGAQWAHELGDTTRALSYLAAAERLLTKIESTYDQACFFEVRAHISRANSECAGDPLRDLRTAEGLFTQVMDLDSAARVRQTIQGWSTSDRLTKGPSDGKG